MNKKIFQIIIVLLVSMLSACNNIKKGLISDEITSVDISLINVSEDGTEEKNKIILEGEELIKLKDKINSIEYKKVKEVYEECKYEILFRGKVIRISSNNKFYTREKGVKTYYEVVNGDFTFLDEYEYIVNKEIYLKDILVIKEYTKIELSKKNNSKKIDLTANESFEEKFNLIKILEINLGEGAIEEKYVINFSSAEVENILSLYIIEHDLIKYSGRYYRLVEGSFDFLDEFNFNNTGWLPWV